MKNGLEKHPMTARIVLAIFGILFSFFLAELVLSGMEYGQYRKPSNRVLFEQYKKIYSDERGKKDYVFGHKPNASVRLTNGEFDFTLNTNSEGLREREDYGHISKSVIFLGDSVVEGSSVENAEVMDEIFEGKTGMVSLNFGVGSFSTAHEYYYIRDKYKDEYNTRLIILGFCLNDFFQNSYLRYFDSDKGNWKLYKYLDAAPASKHDRGRAAGLKQFLKRSKTISFFYRAFRQMINSKVDNPQYDYKGITYEDRYYTELYIRKIKEFSEAIGAEFVVVIFPGETQLLMEYASSDRSQDVLIELLRKNNVRYIDLYDVMKKNYAASPDIKWFYDDIHPNKEGHRLIGEYLADELPKIFPEVFRNN